MVYKFSSLLCLTLMVLSIPIFSQVKTNEKELTIIWRRLVDQKNQTCPRCNETGGEVEKAVKKLKQTFQHLGVVVKYRSEKISPEDFKKAPLASNRVTINGKSVEEWVGGTSGKSPCCASCGTNECRTVQVEGREFEAVPENLIIKASLIAVSNLF